MRHRQPIRGWDVGRLRDKIECDRFCLALFAVGWRHSPQRKYALRSRDHRIRSCTRHRDRLGGRCVCYWHDRFHRLPCHRNRVPESSGRGNGRVRDEIESNRKALLFSTYLGGSDSDQPGLGEGIALDSIGDAYIAGITLSSDLPTTSGAFDTSFNGGGADAFVTKVDASGGALLNSTFLGGIKWEA